MARRSGTDGTAAEPAAIWPWRRERPGLEAELDVVERVRARYPRGTQLSFGAPTRCPRCADYGLVEDVHGGDGSARYRCLRCTRPWTITARALRSVDDERRLPPVPTGPAATSPDPDRRAREAELAPPPGFEGVRFTRSAEGEVVRDVVRAATAPLPPPEDDGVVAGVARVGRRWRPGATLIGLDGGGSERLPLRVLLVEDDPEDAAMVRSLVARAGPGAVDLRTATTRAAGELAARAGVPDLVLLDLSLPDSDGVATLRRWRHRVGDPPVIIVADGCRDEPAGNGAGSDLDLVVDPADPADPRLAGVAEVGGMDGVAGIVDKGALARLRRRGPEGGAAFVQLLRRTSAGLGSAGPGAGTGA